MNKTFNLTDRKKLKDVFLELKPIEKQYRVDYDKFPIGYIYKIINIRNGKIYIGKTTNIITRAAEYVRDYVNNNTNRLINKVLVNYGIENFKMIPIAEYSSNEDGVKKEKFFIRKYNTTNPDKGYNMNNTSSKPKYTGKYHGIRHTAEIKMMKSKFIAAVKGDEVILASGMKLFGDYIGKTKDLVKNRAKNQTRIEGYFIIYLDPIDMKKQIESISSRYKVNVSIDGIRSKVSYFIQICDDITKLIYDDIFINNGYKIKCIIQGENNNFKEIHLIDFLKLIN